MARSGPKPTPTALKILRGNPGKRALPKQEPRGGPLEVEPVPAWIGRHGKVAWKRLAPLLTELGIATEADRTALEVLCATYAEWRDVHAWVKSRGRAYITTNERGGQTRRANPEVQMRSDAARRLHVLLAEFGLTPSARTKVQAAPAGEHDPLEEFLRDGSRRDRQRRRR